MRFDMNAYDHVRMEMLDAVATGLIARVPPSAQAAARAELLGTFGIDTPVGPFPQEPALARRPPFPVPCESGRDGRPQDHEAEGYTVSPEGRPRGAGLLLLVLFLLPCGAACAQPLTGPARVIDGDSLEIQGQRIRLHGVDAPEIRQTCTRPEFNGHDSRPVTCRALGKDRYGRVVARCFVGKPHIDLGGWMVRNGLAVAYTKYSRDYVPQETAARGARLGLWSGAFVPPAEWRRGVR
jgi:endonuclease YncB( thermonuclease family)